MAEVTSGTDLTVIVLGKDESDALARLLHSEAADEDVAGEPALYELYEALVPTHTDEPHDGIHRCRHGVCLDECCATEPNPCGYCLDEAAEVTA
jgi:hypothetical protein